MTLEDIGWNAAFEMEFTPFRAEGWKPARLIRDNKISYGAMIEGGDERDVVLGGKVYHDAETDADLPAVGDWVALAVAEEDGDPVIRARLTRQSCLSRKMPGKSTEEQVIAANVNVAVVLTDAGSDFNLRRMERFFAIIGRSRAKAVVLVNKSDLFADEQNQKAAAAIRALNPEADVHVTSAEHGTSVQVLRQYLQRGVTMAMLGSSGVGKSSVINQLLDGDYQWTVEVNALTGKGRHTTTARELLLLPEGGMLIDNPGIREVHMWTDEKTLRERFADIDALAGKCRFHDCKHGTDTGCAIRAAMAAGTLEAGRFAGFLKLDEEIEKLRRNRRKRQMIVEKRARRDQHTKAHYFEDSRDVEREEED